MQHSALSHCFWRNCTIRVINYFSIKGTWWCIQHERWCVSHSFRWSSYYSLYTIQLFVVSQIDSGICISDAGSDKKQEVKLGTKHCGVRVKSHWIVSVYDKQIWKWSSSGTFTFIILQGKVQIWDNFAHLNSNNSAAASGWTTRKDCEVAQLIWKIRHTWNLVSNPTVIVTEQ